MYELTLEEQDFPYPRRLTITFKTYEEAIEFVEIERSKEDITVVSLVRKTTLE